LEDFQGKPRNVAGAASATWGASIANSVQEVFMDRPSGANPTLTINVANSGTPVTQTTTVAAVSDGLAAAIGARTTLSNFYKGKLGVLVVFNRTLTASEQTALKAWAANYGG